MRRLALLLLGIVVVFAAAVGAINRVVDPSNEFYSSGPLEAALASHCLLADDIVGRSDREFKHDLFRRRRLTRVVFGTTSGGLRIVNMGFPGFGPSALLDAVQAIEDAAPTREQLRILVVTHPSWFNARTRPRSVEKSPFSQARYLFSPWTLKSSLALIRRSRRLAFTGWQKEQAGAVCVIDRGAPEPAWRSDGTFTGVPPQDEATWGGFAWRRLTPLDKALGIAQRHRWRVFGRSAPGPEEYQRELSALFAKHGYRWRIRRMPA